MATLDLRAQAAEIGLVIDPGEALDERGRASAIATWRGRMVNEHVSARVFAALIPQMMAASVDPGLQAEVADMIADELRHARMCAAVVAALGGEAIAELGPLAPVPAHEDVGPLEGLLRNILSISCMSETVAVALIDAERRKAGPAPLARTLREILADEVRHARFGWRLLEALGPTLDAALRARLDDYLTVAFAHLRAHELAHLPARPAPSAAAEAVGVCDGHDARRLFFDTVEQVIVPGLEEHGFQAARAWSASMS
ncbi:MAG: ferritin-like domain-containing protein [Myxococcales bacterium]|nr:ferritin-like domain-containing protein [Myxococcales bacterium]